MIRRVSRRNITVTLHTSLATACSDSRWRGASTSSMMRSKDVTRRWSFAGVEILKGFPCACHVLCFGDITWAWCIVTLRYARSMRSGPQIRYSSPWMRRITYDIAYCRCIRVQYCSWECLLLADVCDPLNLSQYQDSSEKSDFEYKPFTCHQRSQLLSEKSDLYNRRHAVIFWSIGRELRTAVNNRGPNKKCQINASALTLRQSIFSFVKYDSMSTCVNTNLDMQWLWKQLSTLFNTRISLSNRPTYAKMGKTSWKEAVQPDFDYNLPEIGEQTLPLTIQKQG